MKLAPFPWDLYLFTQLNEIGADWLDYFCAWPTHFGDALLLPFVVLAYMLIWDEQRLRKKFFTLLAATLTASFLSTAFKLMIYRPRPYVYYQNLIHEGTFKIHSLFGLLEKESSFPSGHTTVIFAAVTALNLIYRGRLLWIYWVGLFIGFTRVYVGVHFPSDILGGAVLGYLIGRGIYFLAYGPVFSSSRRSPSPDRT